VKVAFHSATKKAGLFTVAEFSTWPLLHEFRACRNGRGGGEVVVRPDGFIRIREHQADAELFEHTFFLEVDRSTETQDTLVTRAGCYLNYYQSGDFAVKNGAPQSAYKDYPFRVLMVFKTTERRNNTQRSFCDTTHRFSHTHGSRRFKKSRARRLAQSGFGQ